ncbi:MAG: protoporphyrinogen oxidase HemJ [Rickettsiales bacterium]|nr:protoporphyrinogen oxidase HemJ [Rickettsiales bacterium]
MSEIELYDVIKILHIVAVISWMAGLLYLPRIFVYHTQVAVNSESDKIFQIMERRLLKFIMLPAMLLVFIFGFYLASEIGFEFVWLHIKITLVLLLAGFHGFLSRCQKNFAAGKNKYSQKFYRIINEVPTLIMIAIVALVILKPF